MAWHVVAKTADLPVGSRRIVVVARRSIGIFNVQGKFYALKNRCPHQGGPLCEGLLLGRLLSDRPGHYELSDRPMLLQCPWHGWEFDLATGDSWFDPSEARVRPYDVEVVQGGSLPVDKETGLVRGPYTAETVPVAVDEEYILVKI